MSAAGLTSRFLRRALDGVLVVEEDLDGVRAVIVRPHPGGRQGVAAAAAGADLAAAVAALRATGHQVPRQALHRTHRAGASLVALPVDPRHPPPSHQMRELVRWELEPYLGHDRGLACGWTALGGSPRDGRWNWLGVGVPEDERRALVAAHAAAGLDLRAILPLVGGAPAALGAGAGSACAVAELAGGVLACAQLDGGTVAAWRVQPLLPGADPVAMAAGMLEGATGPVHLAGAWREADAGTLAAVLGRSCIAMEVVGAAVGAEPWRWAGAVGAATGHAGGCPNPPAAIPPSDPLPPWHADRRVRTALVVAGLAVACLVMALAWRSAGHGLAERLEAERMRERAVQELRAAEGRLADLERRRQLAERTLPDRQRLVPALLSGLAACASDEVVVDALAEGADGVFTLDGRGRSPARIQQFRLRVQEALPDFRLGDGEGARRTGVPGPRQQRPEPGGAAGHPFHLRLEPRP